MQKDVEQTGDAAEAADRDAERGSFSQLTGYRLVDWQDGRAEVRVTVDERHINRSGVLHGGMLTTILDAACGYAGTYSADPDSPRRAFTLSLTCQFVRAARLGETLTATGLLSGGGKSVYFARGEVRNQDGELIGQGDGVFKYITLRN